MAPLLIWSRWLSAKVSRFRIKLLVATIVLACIYNYVLLKCMQGGSLHNLAHLFATGDPAVIQQVSAGIPLRSPLWLQAVELISDTVLIPLYALSLLVYAVYFMPARFTADPQRWYLRLLNWAVRWLPPCLILLSALADVAENSCLTYWVNKRSMPVSPVVMLVIRAVKLYTIYGAAGYISLLFVLSALVIEFVTDLSRNLWYVFKAITLNKYIRCGIAMLRTVWPVCIVLLITYLFLNVMDQARDLLYSLVNDPIYSICVFACLLLYAIVVWYATRILFILRDQRHLIERVSPADPDRAELMVMLATQDDGTTARRHSLPDHRIIDSQTLRAFTRWTPVVLGLVPFFAFMAALGNVEQTMLHQLALAVEIMAYVGIAYQVKNYVKDADADDCNIHSNPVRDLLPIHQKMLLAALLGGISLVILASVGWTNLLLSRFLGPVAIVFLALTMWVLIASFFTYLDYHYKAPFTLICLLIMMFMNNNNHQIRTISNAKDSYFSKDAATHSIPAYFDTWLEQLLADRDKNRATYGSGPVPVYLISTEGGGIRSAYWTATALQQLDNARPDFFRHVFAISGVSGGSVGASVFTAQYRDKLLTKQKNDSTTFSFDLDKFFARDYLSPLLTAMLIPDMLQKFSPFAINSVDRAQYLEDGWADAYADVQQVNVPSSRPAAVRTSRTMDSSFISLWANPATRYRTPVLFLNATQAETGRKGLLTPLVIQNDTHFDNVIDIQEDVYRHIALKTAASISARFPLVTPPATIRVVNEPATDASNFVDGGYLDNSGTTTLLSILSSITSNTAVLAKLVAKNVVFRIISMNNSVETNPNQQVKSLTGLYEVKAPLMAFLGSWDNSSDYRRYAVKEYARGFGNYGYPRDSTGSRLMLSTINLNRRVGVIPLGWDLSEQAEARIQEQARKLYLAFQQPGAYTGLLAGLSTRNKGTTPLRETKLAYASKFGPK